MTPITPQEAGDVDVWGRAWIAAKSLYGGVAFALPYILPAFLGTLAGAKYDQRKMSKGEWLSAAFWTTVTGAILAPLAAHYTSLPEPLSNSMAFLLCLVGYNRTNNVLGVIKRMKSVLGGVGQSISTSDDDGEGGGRSNL